MTNRWMDARLTDVRTALLCARLHLRGGKRRIQTGSSAAGLVALYDAVLFGMRYYIARHKGCESWVQNTDPLDAPALFRALARAGVFQDPLTFDRFSRIVERALWQESYVFDTDSLLTEVEQMLMSLGVIPFHGSPGSGRS